MLGGLKPGADASGRVELVAEGDARPFGSWQARSSGWVFDPRQRSGDGGT